MTISSLKNFILSDKSKYAKFFNFKITNEEEYEKDLFDVENKCVSIYISFKNNDTGKSMFSVPVKISEFYDDVKCYQLIMNIYDGEFNILTMSGYFNPAKYNMIIEICKNFKLQHDNNEFVQNNLNIIMSLKNCISTILNCDFSDFKSEKNNYKTMVQLCKNYEKEIDLCIEDIKKFEDEIVDLKAKNLKLSEENKKYEKEVDLCYKDIKNLEDEITFHKKNIMYCENKIDSIYDDVDDYIKLAKLKEENYLDELEKCDKLVSEFELKILDKDKMLAKRNVLIFDQAVEIENLKSEIKTQKENLQNKINEDKKYMITTIQNLLVDINKYKSEKENEIDNLKQLINKKNN